MFNLQCVCHCFYSSVLTDRSFFPLVFSFGHISYRHWKFYIDSYTNFHVTLSSQWTSHLSFKWSLVTLCQLTGIWNSPSRLQFSLFELQNETNPGYLESWDALNRTDLDPGWKFRNSCLLCLVESAKGRVVKNMPVRWKYRVFTEDTLRTTLWREPWICIAIQSRDIQRLTIRES